MESIEEILLTKIRQKFGSSPTLTDGLTYVGADSIGMAELTVELEKEFEIKMNETIFSLETVQELADYIRSLQQKA